MEKLGLVSGAVFKDLDGDGNPDLVLACEWGPVRVFMNQHGRLVEATEALGLAKFKGWWNGVAVGDFDGDGRMDIVASNWGLNNRWHASEEHPFRVYYGDIAGDRGVDIIEAGFDPAMGVEVPERGLRAVSKALPWIRDRVSGFEAYGGSSNPSTEMRSSLPATRKSRRWRQWSFLTGEITLRPTNCLPKLSGRPPSESAWGILTATGTRMSSSARISSPWHLTRFDKMRGGD